MDLLETEEDQANLPPCSADTFFENAKASEKKISHKYTLGDILSPTFCLRFDHNDKYIAAGRGDGRRCAPTGPARNPRQVPRIVDRSVVRVVAGDAVGVLVHAGLAEHHRPIGKQLA